MTAAPPPAEPQQHDAAPIAPRDRLTLTGIRAHAHHGIFGHERRDGQPFIIDVELSIDLAPAAGSDDIAHTVHYGDLAVEIVEAVEADPVDLIETVAERIAGLCLRHGPVHAVTVTVHKPEAPIPVPFDDVSVTITRGRA
jgi:dihydroneopterin aldolase